MQEKVISFETAKLAKEKGFDSFKSDTFFYDDSGNLKINSKCFPYFYAPTQSLLQKWLREVYNIHIQIELEPGITSKTNQFQTYLYDLQNYDNNIRLSYYNLYEEALEKALQEALKLIKNVNKSN